MTAVFIILSPNDILHKNNVKREREVELVPLQRLTQKLEHVMLLQRSSPFQAGGGRRG